MIDIHAHVLPGIDDGPGDLELAVDICRQAASLGTKALIATPHQRHPTWWNTEPLKLERLLGKIKQALGNGPELYLGAEIRVDSGFLPSLDRLEQTGVQPLASSSYLLLEFHRRSSTEDPIEVVERVQEAGWRPIIAHPEFIPSLRRATEAVAQLVDAGALMQVTAMSITGDFGEDARESVHRLLDQDLVHFVASDCHDSSWRPPGIRKARKMVAARWGDAVARRITDENPQAVLENRVIEASASAANQA